MFNTFFRRTIWLRVRMPVRAQLPRFRIRMREGKNLDIILDELYPEFKEELIGKYIYEMPDEIVNLQKKYKKINFTNEIYKKYINDFDNKGKEKEIKEDNK